MGIAVDIKKLGEDIVTCYDLRIKAIGSLVKNTHKMLKEFRADHKDMAVKQAKELESFVTGLTKNVGNMIKGFQKDHKDMAVKQAKELEYFVTDLTKNVGNMIKGFQKDHKDMADELKETLEKAETDRLKGETNRLKYFKGMMANIQKSIKQIETYVAEKLKEFSDSHADMSEELKKDLAKYVAGIVGNTKKLLAGFADEREKMAANWQAMAVSIAKRRGIKPKVEAEVKVRPVKEAIEEVVEEVVELEERVLRCIESHTEGVKVGDMGESLGVARTSLGKIAKKLLDEGKVRKEENMYFPLF